MIILYHKTIDMSTVLWYNGITCLEFFNNDKVLNEIFND